MKLSFIIPCYGSENTVDAVIAEIRQTVAQKRAYDYEIICVNDCSPDDVLTRLYEIAKEDPLVKVISLAKNMGKHSAMMAGYAYVTGDIVVNLDDDGQCPLDRLWDLLAPVENGYDIAIAKYEKKKQSGFKNFGSWLNSKMACWLLSKPAELYLSNFSAFRRFVCQELIRYKNAFPYIDGLMLRTTAKIVNVEMEERERISGNSGYTLIKSLRLFANGFTSFSVKPLRMATLMGCACAFIGFVLGLVVVVRKIVNPAILSGYSSLMAMLLLIGGIVMLLLGIIGEYIGRIYICINNSPQYVIRETLNCEDDLEAKP